MSDPKNVNNEPKDNFWFKLFFTVGVIAVIWYNFSPFFDNPYRERIGAICADGWRSYATGSGACSHHGGVDEWLYEEVPYATGVFKKVVISLIIGWIAAFPALAIVDLIKERITDE